jgi:Putative metal-binding motif
VAAHGRIATAAVAVLLALAGAGLAGGCGGDERDLFVTRHDAGVDAPAAEPDAEPGFDPTLGGPCTEDAQCDDALGCTYDKCDAILLRCRNTPDDAQCEDGTYCNGREVCVLRKGCTSSAVVTCQDDTPCTIDRCIEGTKSCEHKERDVDGDGDPDDHCVSKKDCDDTDPTVSSALAEICGNFKDDDCDGQTDEQPCSEPANDVCAKALAVTASGTYLLTTVAAKKDYATTCSVATPTAARDIVVAITAPAGAPSDIEVWATTQAPDNEAAVALQGACGAAGTELGCANIPGSGTARAIARSVAGGATVYAVVTTQKEGAVDVKVDLRGGTTKPTNESCAAPQPVTVDAPFTVSLIDAGKDVATACTGARTGDLTYQFTLAQPRDVRIFASTLSGNGQAVVSIRDASCTDELRCRMGSIPPVFARSLPAGTHVFSVAATGPIDASLLVKTYAPTTPPPNQACATAPPLPINTSFYVDLSNQEDAIKNGCLPGGPAAAYDLLLTEASDVLVVGRFPQTETGAVSINGPACTTAERLACTEAFTPARATRRNLAAGDYKVVVADQTGQNAQLNVLVRPTVTPTIVSGSDDCTSAVTIPATGGYFTGDATNLKADFNAGCDAPGMPLGGSRDQILRLDLTQQRRVVFDMTGSFFTTVLDVRKGATCPGAEVPGLCYIGFGANRSFLDVTLDPGTYWVQIDGYAGEVGPWNLDVRVLAP